MEKMTVETPAAKLTEARQEAVVPATHVCPRRVLYATDGSEAASAAARLLALLPLPSGSAVQAVLVLDAHPWQVPESLKGAEREWGRGVLGEAEARLAREGVQVTHSLVRGAPAFEILKAADAFDADLVVVGSHGRTGLERFLLGSVAENVAKHTRHPVLVARTPTQGLRRVVLAVDGSEHAARAADFIVDFPLPSDTAVTVCHVFRPYYATSDLQYAPELTQIISEMWKQQQQDAEQLVASIAGRVKRSGKEIHTVVRSGDPATELLDLLKEQEADMIVAGTRGKSAIETLLVGSVADRLLKYGGCSVLLVT
jgi:nucleotide-binding universal stress UspA family protein